MTGALDITYEWSEASQKNRTGRFIHMPSTTIKDTYQINVKASHNYTKSLQKITSNYCFNTGGIVNDNKCLIPLPLSEKVPYEGDIDSNGYYITAITLSKKNQDIDKISITVTEEDRGKTLIVEVDNKLLLEREKDPKKKGSIIEGKIYKTVKSCPLRGNLDQVRKFLGQGQEQFPI